MSQPIYRVMVLNADGASVVHYDKTHSEEAYQLAEEIVEQCPSGGSVYVTKVLSIYTLTPKRTDLK